MIAHTLMLLLALGAFVGLYKLGFYHGRNQGKYDEELRIQGIFHETTDAIYGGAVHAVWERVNNRTTREQMVEKLRESQARRERDKKRLASYEAAYGPIDLKGASSDEEGSEEG